MQHRDQASRQSILFLISNLVENGSSDQTILLDSTMISMPFSMLCNETTRSSRCDSYTRLYSKFG